MAEDWTASKQANGHWNFEWSSGISDGWDIWHNGVLLTTVTGGEYEAEIDGYDTAPPPLEIVPEDSDAESNLYPPYVIIQWRGDTSALAYRVQKYINESWVTLKTIQERARGWYVYRSGLLDDDTETRFRVQAYNPAQNLGTALGFWITLMRNPAPPSVEFSIDSSGDLVVEES